MAENPCDRIPKKGLFRSDVAPCHEYSVKKRNQHIKLQYQNGTWYLGLFGKKDNTSAGSYFKLKAELCGLASVIYRMTVFKGSPKYFAVYDKAVPDANFGFLTKEIRRNIGLSALLEAIQHIREGSFSYTALRWLASLKERVVALIFIKLSYDPDANSQAFTKKEDDEFERLLNKSLSTIEEGETAGECLSLSQFDAKFFKLVAKLKMDFKLEDKIQEFCCKTGLAELMAVSYFLGEFDFKADDVLFDPRAGCMRRIDHERVLWSVVRSFLWSLRPDDDRFPDPRTTHRAMGLFSSDIENFPQREAHDVIYNDCETWFSRFAFLETALQSAEAREHAYQTWLLLVLIPEKMYEAIAKDYMSAESFEPVVIKYLLERKHYLEVCLTHSSKFLAFLQQCPLSFFKVQITRHNKKYPEYWIDSHEIELRLLGLQKTCKSMSGKTECGFVITPDDMVYLQPK